MEEMWNYPQSKSYSKLECIRRMHYRRMGLCTEHLCWPVRTQKQVRLRRGSMLPQGVSLFVCLMVLAWTGRALAGKNLWHYGQVSILGQIFFLYSLISSYLMIATWPEPELIFLSANPIIDIQLVFNFDQSCEGFSGHYFCFGPIQESAI